LKIIELLISELKLGAIQIFIPNGEIMNCPGLQAGDLRK